jgi:hypothetical protein
MKAQHRRRFEHDRGTDQPTGAHEERTPAGDQTAGDWATVFETN